MKTTVCLILVSLLCFAFAACATPAETAAAIGAVGASVVGIVDAIGPLLPPEQLAKLQATAASIDGTVEATRVALGAVADVVTAFKGSVGAQLQQHTENLGRAMTSIAELPGRGEVYGIAGGTGTAGTAASRLLSNLKHRAKPVRVA